MPPDAPAPPSPPDTAPPSSRNALRGGVLAALSTAPMAGQAAAQPPALAGAVASGPAPYAPTPSRGFGASLRAAARRGLVLARPLALPFLHRLQMRMRTAVDESSVAQALALALARLSDRLEAEAAASRRGIADLGSQMAENARRLDALGAAAAAADAMHREALQRRFDEVQQRLDAMEQGIAAMPGIVFDEVQQRLDAMEQGIAAMPGIVPPRAPIPLGGGEMMVWTPDGYLLLPTEDLRLLAAMSDGGVLERGTRVVLAALLQPGGTFLDIGAHVGTMTLLGARRVGEGGRVFAIEPLPRLAALLRRNLALNGVADRAAVSACAAGEGDAEALLHIGEVLGHSSLLPLDDAPGAETARVPVRRIDDLVPTGTRIDVAKIDAEGAELQVWRGMRRVLEESPRLAAILEFGPSHLARAGVTPEAWLGELQSAGFAAYAIDELTGACRSTTAAALAGTFSTNVLLLRPGAAARHPELVFA